jgi:hypothetical protein
MVTYEDTAVIVMQLQTGGYSRVEAANGYAQRLLFESL